MGKTIGYAKLGRSMPLTLEKCGNLGGDVEMVAVVKELAVRHPDDTFLLIGRNSGEVPSQIGLPRNIVNPWSEWGWSDMLRAKVQEAGLKGVTLTSERQLELQKIFDYITLHTITNLDGIVMWIGQHGTSNAPIPKVDDPSQLTKPQDWCAWYAAYLLRGINHFRDRDPWKYEEINLNADSRNRHKMRDLKWPLRHPILAQHNFSHPLKHERYDEPLVSQGGNRQGNWCEYGENIGQNTWLSTVHNTYARLEVNGLRPGTPFGNLISFDDTWHRSGEFGLFINEARKQTSVQTSRFKIMKEWVLPLDPYFVHGSWSADSLAEMGRVIKPAPWDQYFPSLHSVRTTFTTPSSGSGWATAKPWEAFAAGTVCFFHPEYDTQNNILDDAPATLKSWLRVNSAKQLRNRIEHLSSTQGKSDWYWIVNAQRKHFERAISELKYMQMIEERLYSES